MTEFNNLFASLFKNSGVYEEIIKTIASHRYGIGKRELLEKINKSLVGKGGLEKLKALKDAGFILDFKPHLHKEKGIYYKLIDHYSLFYLYWILPVHDTLLVRSLAKGSPYPCRLSIAAEGVVVSASFSVEDCAAASLNTLKWSWVLASFEGGAVSTTSIEVFEVISAR